MPEPPEPDFGQQVISQFDEIFWQPEIERRGGPGEVGPIHKALAILAPGEPTKVLFNDEFEAKVTIRTKRAIVEGEFVTPEDMDGAEDLEPMGVDPNAGWACIAVLPNGQAMLSFDFRRNRGRSGERVARAEEFAATARSALDAGRLGPALDNAFTAAELAVTAEALLLESNAPEDAPRGRNPHGKRREWLKGWTELGNAPTSFSQTLGRLAQVRSRARYAEREIDISREEAAELVGAAEEMVAHSQRRLLAPRGDLSEPADAGESGPGASLVDEAPASTEDLLDRPS